MLILAKIQWKGGALLGPLPPALIVCGALEHPNVMTAAWTGILNTIPPKTYVSIRPERYSHGIIRERGEFSINLTTASMVYAADFCGVRSGRDCNKFALTGLTPLPSSALSCPVLAQSPVSLLCKVSETVPLGSHDMFLADIVAVEVDDQYLDQAGKLHLERCELAAYAHGDYYALGKRLGSFGYSVRKKPQARDKKKRRPK